MKFCILAFFLLSVPFFCAAEEEKKISLQEAIEIALQNNYDIQNQRFALESAKAQYRQANVSLDIEAGAQAQYSRSQNPVDKDDPNYTISQQGFEIATTDNTLSEQTAGSVYLKKLFGFGLETKLSYTVKRAKNTSEYDYSSSYLAMGGTKLEEKARNTGDIALELSLPLFKSFKNSLTNLQIDAAKDYIAQMEFALSDTISQTIVSVSSQYWNYLLAYKNLENLEILQEKIEDRLSGMDTLIRAGVRSRNDFLALQVNVNENRRSVQDAKVQFSKAKMEFATTLGLSDFSVLGVPEDSFSEIDLSSLTPPKTAELNDDFFAKVEESRADLKSLKTQVEMALKKVQMSKVDSLPDASLNFGIGTTGTAYSDNLGETVTSGFKNVRGVNVNGTVSVSAKLGNNAKKGALEQYEAEYSTAVNNYNKAKNTLALQIQNAAEKLEIYKNQVSGADDVLSLQKTLYENEQKRFNAGLITVDDLLTQDQKHLSAELSYYQILINYMQAILEFKYYTAQMVE